MNQLSNDFNQFFEVCFQASSSSLLVQEFDKNAKLEELTINCPNHLVLGLKGKEPLKNQWKGVHSQDRDCDGIALLEKNNLVDRILLVELKSKFKEEHLYKSVTQIVISYLKIHSLLALCSAYDQPLALYAIIACTDDSSLYSTVYNQVISGVSPNLLHYVTENPIRRRLLDIMNDFGINSSGLSEDILRTPVTLYRTCSDNQSRHNFTLA